MINARTDCILLFNFDFMVMSENDNLKVYQTGKHGDPLNAETTISALVSNYITPITHLFHRNHDDIVYEPETKSSYTDWKISFRVDRDVADEQRWAKWNTDTANDAKLFTVMDLVQASGICKGVEHIDTTATIECAGNRREELGETEKAEGIQWGPGVIANVYWSGTSIRSLLLLQGIPDPYSHHDNLQALTPSDTYIHKDCAPWAQQLHLHLLSAQPTSESEKPEGEFFGASIPLSTAMHPNQQCILAYQHNGKTLTQAHGFPLRAIIPGHAGARWVKWLNGLRISKFENDSPPMHLDYKILSPPIGLSEGERNRWKEKMMGDEKDDAFRKGYMDEKEPMQRLGMGSAIETPSDNQTIRGDTLIARGYAVGQDGSPVSLVECLLLEQSDPAESSLSLRNRAEKAPSSEWSRAKVQTRQNDDQDSKDIDDLSWAWTLWEVQIDVPKGSQSSLKYGLVARATTTSGIVQEKESPWNVRGFQTRSWPVIRGLHINSNAST